MCSQQKAQRAGLLLGGARRCFDSQGRRSSWEAAIYPSDEPEGIVTQDVIRFRPNQARVCAEYIANFLNSSLGRHRVKGITVKATRARFSLGDFKKLVVDILPMDIQRTFAARVAEIDKLKARYRNHLTKLDALFASLQHRAFRGEL